MLVPARELSLLVAYKELHLGDLLVNLLHKLNDEVDQLVLQHLLCMEVGDQEGDVVSLDRFPPEDNKALCSLLQEPCELVDQNVFDLICLLNLDAYAHAVDAGLDEDALVLVTRDGKRVQNYFGRRCGFDFGHIVSFRGLRGEVGQRDGGRERGAHALQVRAEGLRLQQSV